MNEGEEEKQPKSDAKTSSSSTFKALSSVVDLICEQFDDETNKIIGDNLVNLKESLAIINKEITDRHKTASSNTKDLLPHGIEDAPREEEPSQFPEPPTRTPPSTDILPSIEHFPSEKGTDTFSTNPTIEVQFQQEQQRIKGSNTILRGEKYNDTSPSRRRSRRLSQPFLSPLSDSPQKQSKVSILMCKYHLYCLINKRYILIHQN